MNKSAIQYADYSWNPVTGCAPGLPCASRCWAAAMHRRFHPGEDFWTPKEHPEVLDRPLRTKRPGVVAVAFGGDLFAEGISISFTYRVFGAMVDAPKHTYLVLTKRPQRMAWLRNAAPVPHILLGTSVSTQADVDERVPHLLDLAARGWRTWLSVEPMLQGIGIRAALPPHEAVFCESRECGGCGDGDEPCAEWKAWRKRRCSENLCWVVCGAESGPDARPLDVANVQHLRNQCLEAGVPFFYKQGPGDNPETFHTRTLDRRGIWDDVQVGHKTVLLPRLDGRTHAAMPEVC